MKRNNRLEQTAYHEAGHAVAHVYLHIPFKQVSLKVDGDFLGGVVGYLPPKSFQPDLDASLKIRNRIEKEMIIILAGHAAEVIFAGRHNWKGATSDTQKAVDLTMYCTGSEEEATALYRWMWVRTKNWVRQPLHWMAISALAKALLKVQTITANKVRVIIDDALKRKLNQ